MAQFESITGFAGLGEGRSNGHNLYFKLNHYHTAQELDFITNDGTIAALEQSEQANPHSICGSLTPPHPAIPQTVV